MKTEEIHAPPKNIGEEKTAEKVVNIALKKTVTDI